MSNSCNTLIALGMLTMAGGVVASPTVYIPLGSANEVIAVDAATDKITATYTGVANPHGLVATPDGEYLVAGSLVENPGATAQAANSKLYLVHPAHGHVMLEIPVAGWTHHEAITPDGRYVISTHTTRQGVSVVDLQSNKVVATIKTGIAPNYTVVTPDGKTAYVTNTGSGNISVIDLATYKVTSTLESGPAPEHMVMSRDGKTLYVANVGTGTVSAVSIASGKVDKSWKLASSIHGLDMGDDGKRLFASSKSDNKLFALNIATGQVRELALSPSPYHLNTITGTGKVYVSSSKKPVIWVVDQADLKVIDEIKLPGGEGHQMAIVQ